ncbi:MAG: winged helix-turn-helix domain-containing protein [Pseudomonadota bacterium]
MDESLKAGFTLGEWHVLPLEGRITGSVGERRLRPRTMDLLVHLAVHAGEVLPRDALIDAVWGANAVADEPLTRTIADLRQALGDKRHQPQYIETIPKRGYKLLLQPSHLAPTAQVNPDATASLPLTSTPWRSRVRAALATGLGVAMLVTLTTLLVTRSPETPAPPTLTVGPAVAVLPFELLSTDQGDEMFAEGLSDTLTHVLAKVQGLRVIARRSAAMFRDGGVDVREIGNQLGVSAVLEGSVQRDDRTLRILARLISTRDGTSLWAGRFDRSPQDLFAVQDEIAAEVAAAMHIVLLPERREHATRVAFATENLQAYDAYVEGQRNLGRRTTASIAAAIDDFRRAVTLDPSYSLAWVGLADAHIVLRYYGNISLERMEAQASNAIDRALAIEPDLGEAYASLGLLNWELSRIAEAEAALRRAIAMAPNYSQAYFWLATVYNDTGRSDQALPMHRLALELDPLAPNIHTAIAVALEKLGRFEEAREQYAHIMQIDSGYGAAIDRAAQLHWSALARLDNAIRLEQLALEVDPGYTIAPALLTELFLDLGDTQEAERWLSEAQRLGADTDWPHRARALLLTYAEEDPQARFDLARERLPGARNSETREILLRVARDVLLARGEPGTAVTLYAATYPSLTTDSPQLDSHTLGTAVDFAFALRAAGQATKADRLLRAAEQILPQLPRLGCCGYGSVDVEILVQRGELAQAVDRLSEAVDSGWRRHWWWETRANPALAALREDPRYQRLLNRLEAHGASQRLVLE